jgi:hypothetical protein
MAAVPAMATATDAQKQEYAEAMLIQAAMIDSSKEVYENDPQMMQQLSAAVAKGAKAMGLDLSKMELTENGFVPAK